MSRTCVTNHRKCLIVASDHRVFKGLKLRPHQFEAKYELTQRAVAARIQYCDRFPPSVFEGFMCSSYDCVLNGTPYSLSTVTWKAS